MADFPEKDWDDLGRTIEDIIDRAVNSRNYQKLNQTITQAVNMAAGTGGEAIRRAREAQRKAAQSRPVYTYTPSKEPEPKKNLPVLYGNATGKTATGIAKTVGGGFVTGGTSLALVGSALYSSIFGGTFLTAPVAFLLAALSGGVFLLGSGIRSLGKMSRYKVYLKTLGEKTYCNLDQLARNVGKSTKFVRKELRGMINEGLFLEGHIDEEGTSLITSNETYGHYQQARLQLQERQRQELAEARMQVKSQPVTAQVQEVLDRGEAFVKEIHRCNDQIPGEEISNKIYRMEMIVEKIFERAKAHPEIVPELKKLMDYYLPMTVKLLNAYAEMDRQPVQGETIQSSKREIEDTLDTLNTAFEKLLDSVFRDTAMDVSSDISVLHTLLAQEGLTEDDINSMHREK